MHHLIHFDLLLMLLYVLNASSNTLLFASAVVISSGKLVFVISPSFKSFESFCFFKIGELSQKGLIALFYCNHQKA